MTMKREAKAAALHRNIEILLGAERVPSPSPKRVAEFGRYLPPTFAASLLLSMAREIKYINREYWATDRRGRRRTVRVA